MENHPDINLYILTFNCARTPIDTDAFASQLFNGLTTTQLPDLLVLSLQEIAPIALSFLGGSLVSPYFARFRDAIEDAARKVSNSTIYTNVLSQNLGMTALLIFAKDPSRIQDTESGGVGVGLWEMGNKGAIGARFTYQEGSSSTVLTFVAAHFAAMEHELKRRNRDWENTVRRLIFSNGNHSTLSVDSEETPLLSSPETTSIYHPESHLFFAGDLNYRTSNRCPSPTDHIKSFPQPHENTTSQNHYSNLFSSDQLNQERLASRTCHGLIEPEVTFPPTYKYNQKGPFLTPDEDLSRWPWATHRWPSWCDRILYLPVPSWLRKSQPEVKIATHKYCALPLLPTSDHRAVTLHLSVPVISISKPTGGEEDEEDPRIKPRFEVDVNWKSRRQRARRLEVIIGCILYLTTMWEGILAVMGSVVGVVGAWFVLKAVLSA